METQKYEQLRLANIKRNADMLKALNVQSTIDQLIALSYHPKRKYIKKPRTHVVRQSLRCRGIAPQETPTETPKIEISTLNSIYKSGSIKFRDAFVSNSGLDDRKLGETILGVSKNSQITHATHNAHDLTHEKVHNSIALDSLRLGPQKISPRLFPSRAFSMRFLPSNDKTMVVVGGDSGNLGFWNVDSVDDGDRMYVYRPHTASVSGIVFQNFSMSKIFTCSTDGSIRLMDIERETFDLAYSGADSICSISQRPNDVKSLYFGEGQGKLNVWDETARKPSSLWNLHEGRINSIEFNACNTNIMATSSSDGTACIWDLRKVAVDKPEPLNTVNHKRVVISAYFSPSGNLLATTSTDGTVGLLSGANYDSVSMIHHNNSLSCPLRGSWGWDDYYIFIGNSKGNMKGGVDVISTVTNRCIDTIRSPDIPAVPRFFEKHPGNVGMLAGATCYGLVYLWTSC